MADRPAGAVRRQWEAEAEVRRLGDPYPLPASPGREAPGGPVNDPGRWADGPEGLSGSGHDIEEVFLDRVPTRRLVVLGEPGAGKTMVMVRLLLVLVDPAHRTDGGPVPFLFALASFDPAGQDLRTWMVQELTWEHPALGGPAQGLGTRSGGRRLTLPHPGRRTAAGVATGGSLWWRFVTVRFLLAARGRIPRRPDGLPGGRPREPGSAAPGG
ncbi:hypothetical protein ABT373_13115 [Streptomyces sp. NPDC000070]|uniref:hypothetical protein n=1 Tax=Streptomyces sp. NPDC000070 TaxID=3154240 RepID=UPI00331A4354